MEHFAAKTPLASRLTLAQESWLLQWITDDYNLLAAKVGDWRQNLKKYEEYAKEDFSRRGERPDSQDDAIRSIFELQNDSLNVVGGFADFAYATARDDIMGTRPFFSATPEGLEDANQADIITKHAHWKLGQTDFHSVLSQCLLSSVQLGNAFPKTTWRQVTETSETIKTVLADKKGNPITTATGDYFYPEDREGFQEVAEEGATIATIRSPKDPFTAIPRDSQWVEAPVEEVETVFDNAQTDLIHFERFVADPKAPRLCLLETNVYHEFDIDLLDAIEKYELDPSKRQAVLENATRTHESEGAEADHPESYNPASNPKIRLIEGYVRVDPFETGSPVRIYVIFDPIMDTLFHIDYLANVTPGGRLPIFSIPCYPQPHTWIAKGFYERYELVQEYVDKHFSAVGYRNRIHSNPISFLDSSQLEDGEEIENIFSSPGKTYHRKSGATARDVIEFVEIPDLDDRTVEMMNIMIQVAQMRTGISSAAQGELSSLPDTNTATGVNSILSRAATLLKWPVSEMADGIEKLLNYNMVLLYSNQDFDETFTWGEGRDVALLQLDRAAAKNLHYHVKILLTQSHNREKLESSNAAIGIMAQYVSLPELEKASQRPLYVQAIKSLGFDNAEDIVRPPLPPPAPEEAGAAEEENAMT